MKAPYRLDLLGGSSQGLDTWLETTIYKLGGLLPYLVAKSVLGNYSYSMVVSGSPKRW